MKKIGLVMSMTTAVLFSSVMFGVTGCKEDNERGVPTVKKEQAFQKTFWDSSKVDATPSKGF